MQLRVKKVESDGAVVVAAPGMPAISIADPRLACAHDGPGLRTRDARSLGRPAGAVRTQRRVFELLVHMVVLTAKEWNAASKMSAEMCSMQKCEPVDSPGCWPIAMVSRSAGARSARETVVVGSRVYRRIDDLDAWVVSCFFVRKDQRGKGYGRPRHPAQHCSRPTQ